MTSLAQRAARTNQRKRPRSPLLLWSPARHRGYSTGDVFSPNAPCAGTLLCESSRRLKLLSSLHSTFVGPALSLHQIISGSLLKQAGRLERDNQFRILHSNIDASTPPVRDLSCSQAYCGVGATLAPTSGSTLSSSERVNIQADHHPLRQFERLAR